MVEFSLGSILRATRALSDLNIHTDRRRSKDSSPLQINSPLQIKNVQGLATVQNTK